MTLTRTLTVTEHARTSSLSYCAILIMTPFAQAGASLLANGYSPIPIMPGAKVPGQYAAGEWKFYKGWNLYCTNAPNAYHIKGWSNWPDAGVGVACGRGLICIDIDDESIQDTILALLPPSPVQKKGRKGVSLFYRGDTGKIKSRNYRTKEKAGLLDLIAEGKQTVLPPSVHPDTNEPYYWWTDATLCDTPLSALPELPDDIAEQIGEALKPFGYDPDGDHPAPAPTALVGGGDDDGKSYYRQINDAALANLHAWVPHLGLRRWYRAGGGFKAVAEWRESGSGRAFHLRSANLNFTTRGIRDFGDGRGYTPIDVVMEALHFERDDAYVWLAKQLGIDTGPKIKLVNTSKAIATAEQRARGLRGVIFR